MADETWRSRNFALFIRYLILAPSPARSLLPCSILSCALQLACDLRAALVALLALAF